MITEQPAKVKAFEQRKLRPGNRRMATLAGAYSVDRHVRAPEQIVAALFRDESPDDDHSLPRPTPQFKQLSAHFPEFYEDGPDSFRSTGSLEANGWLVEQVERRRQKRQPLLLLIDGDHKLWDVATAKRLAELGDGPVLVYCEVGQRGHTAAALLTELGIAARNLDGGYQTWVAARRAGVVVT